MNHLSIRTWTRSPSGTAHLLRLGVAVLVAGALTLIAVGVALAHANLVRSNPPAGANLKSPPRQVQLWFSEPIEPSFSRAVVYDTRQDRVDLGDSHVALNNPESLIVGLKPNLPRGSYAIAWVTQSKVDGHIVRGLVPFGIGVSAATTVPTAGVGVAAGAVSGSPVEMALRWLILFAATTLVGAFPFWILQGATFPATGDPGSSDAEILSIQTRIAAVLWVVFVIANIAYIVDQASIAAGVPPTEALGTPFLETLATQYGEFWLLRMGLAAVLGALLLARQGRLAFTGLGPVCPATVDRIAIGVGAVLLAGFSFTSHSAAIGSFTSLGITIDWLHLAATTVWIGGLIQLAALAPILRRAGSFAMLGALVARFAVVAGGALGLIAITGLGEALLHVGTVANLVATGYGQALAIKIALVVPLGTLAAINHFVVRPVLRQARDHSTPIVRAQARDTAGLFNWTIRFEALFAVAVLLMAGVLTSLSPPQQYSGVAKAGPLRLTQTSGGLVTTLAVSPGRPGPNQIRVAVRDARGQVPAGIETVFVRFTDLDSNLGTSEAILAPQSGGQFSGQTGDLAVAGRWKAEVVVRRAGRDDVWTTFAFTVSTNGALPLQQSSSLNLTWRFYTGLLVALAALVVLGGGFRIRRRAPRRAALFAIVALCAAAGGSFLALREVQQAQARASAQTLSLRYPATPSSIARGVLIYRQNCAICHGVSLQGDGPMAPSLSPPPANLMVHVPLHSDMDLANWIAHGYPGSAMPAFAGKLTEQQRWDVLNYIKSLADGGAPPATSNLQSTVAPPSASTPGRALRQR